MKGGTARVLMLEAPRQLHWRQVPLPVPEAGQVLVQTQLSAISVSSELSVVEGRVEIKLPRRLGYQTLGRVQDAGDGVSLPPGARVVTTSGHVSAAVVAATACIPVPDHVSDRMALAVILGEETYKGIRKVNPAPHERVLVAGAGLLGLLTVFNLRQRGIAEIGILEPDPDRRALAVSFGARTPDDRDAAFDVGFECSASPAGFHDLLSRMRPAGRVCVLSDGNWGQLTLPPAFHTRELSIVASSDGEDYRGYAAWLWRQPGTLLERLFVRTIRPDGLIDQFRTLLALPRPVSVVVDWRN